MTTRVLLVDDDAQVLDALGTAFGRQRDFDVVGCAADGEQAVALARRLDPDVIVMDVRMPKMSGLEAATALRQLGIRTPIVFLTADLEAAAERGGVGPVRFLIKADVGVRETVAAARAVTQGRRGSPAVPQA